MTDNDTTTGAPGARGVETAEQLFDRKDAEYLVTGNRQRVMLTREEIEQRDAAIDARARREERAAALREVADKLDITAQDFLLGNEYGAYEHWIDARNVVLLMLEPLPIATPNAAPGSDGGVAL